MNRLKYVFVGEKTEAFITSPLGSSLRFYTNNEGRGIFIDIDGKHHHVLMGTAQFDALGSKGNRRKKMREYIKEYFDFYYARFI